MTPVLSSEFAPVFDEPFRSSPRTWVIGAVGALALHVAGGALVFGYMHDQSVDLGAPGLVIDVDLTAPRQAPNELPVGPDTEASARAPGVVEQKTVIQKNDLPKDTPTDTDDPERIVSSEDVKQPVDQDPKITAVKAAPSNPSVAAEETAILSAATARESVASRTPSPGTGESALRERVTWQKELAAHFDKYKRYPEDREVRSAEVVVNFVLDDAGHILSSRVRQKLRRSGVRRCRAVDDAAFRPGAATAAARCQRWTELYNAGDFSRQGAEVIGPIAVSRAR